MPLVLVTQSVYDPRVLGENACLSHWADAGLFGSLPIWRSSPDSAPRVFLFFRYQFRDVQTLSVPVGFIGKPLQA